MNQIRTHTAVEYYHDRVGRPIAFDVYARNVMRKELRVLDHSSVATPIRPRVVKIVKAFVQPPLRYGPHNCGSLGSGFFYEPADRCSVAVPWCENNPDYRSQFAIQGCANRSESDVVEEVHVLEIPKPDGNWLRRWKGSHFVSPEAKRNLWSFLFGREVLVTEAVQDEAVALVDELDVDTIEDHTDPEEVAFEQIEVRVKSPRDRYPYITLLANQCKTEVTGITEENPANRLVAQRWLLTEMKRRKMRPKHIKQMLPLAVEMVFTPNIFEIQAAQVRQSRAVLSRKAALQAPYSSRGNPWLFNWFGTKYKPVATSVA